MFWTLYQCECVLLKLYLVCIAVHKIIRYICTVRAKKNQVMMLLSSSLPMKTFNIQVLI